MTTRGRPKSFCPDRALENAMQLFWQRGYEAASLQDLQAATGLSRSSLYQTYPSKQAWFVAAFSRYVAQRRALLLEQLDASTSPLAFIRERLLSVLEDDGPGGVPRGCMLVNVANEFSLSEPALVPVLQQATAGICQVFEEALARAVACGELRNGQDLAARAGYLQCVMSGLRTQVKSAVPADSIRATVAVVMTSLDCQ
ncbi:TetR/AcrR family transcriptional regulator [Ectopseudomonas guguanensis]|uniref:TetR/AcrR family transcriptional regulator n=1 Tax=Ectopseudomonas guguanensis TaxID=1198456 RepID=UPI00285565DC|nr:TetR/AcrR family transcriptional regulator [Pseudomonas guguanensis]MDR8013162.1 TetR/AcrR family transcriptional regulator [Pseudomonas guguanensis]